MEAEIVADGAAAEADYTPEHPGAASLDADQMHVEPEEHRAERATESKSSCAAKLANKSNIHSSNTHAHSSINVLYIFSGQKRKATLMNALTLICIFLFIGAMGKSAQLFLHTWLPDAMEGPTPVSALIHAATMVTAGVFLVVRCSPLFDLAPIAMDFVVVIGASTAFFAATIGLVQNDIKRVIAYSTCSQLGYMFVAAGLGAYGVAMFHLFTHAFFKALLFLGAGSVIHSVHEEQDIRKMGGISNFIPITQVMMIIGTISLMGFPFTSGYYSKDAIIETAYLSNSNFADYAYILLTIGVVMTSFLSLIHI